VSVVGLYGAIFVAAAWLMWNGVKAWRGEEGMPVARFHPDHPSGLVLTGYWGNRRIYRSQAAGWGITGFLAGVGLIGLGIAELGVDMEIMERDTIAYNIPFAIGGLPMTGGLPFVLIYTWIGVPDRLRPPCQRGWKEVRFDEDHPKGVALVRPEVAGEHPKWRPPEDRMGWKLLARLGRESLIPYRFTNWGFGPDPEAEPADGNREASDARR
jgi:hypothetical protein